MPNRTNIVIKGKCTAEGVRCNETLSDKKSKKFQPRFLGAAERRHFLHDMVKSFPQSIQNRVTVLKNVQIDQIAKISEFHKAISNLEVKYAAKYQKFYDQRFAIISGKFDPPKQDAKWKIAVNDKNAKGDHNFDEALKEYKKLSSSTIGIPNFWLTVFRNVDVIAHLIEKHDEPLLRKLIDVRDKCYDANSFTIEFHFEENDYFTDKILTKKYTWNFDPDKKMPFQYDGPLVCKTEGCRINWKKNMNLTLKQDANTKLFKNVPRPSFFHYFNPPVVQESGPESMDDDIRETLTLDYDLGLFFRSRIIPRAVLYFTGDVPEFDPCSSDEDQSENDDSDNLDDLDDSEDSDDSNEEGAAEGASANTHSSPLLSNECNPQ